MSYPFIYYRVESRFITSDNWYDHEIECLSLEQAKEHIKKNKKSCRKEDLKDFEWRIIKYKGEVII